MAERKIIDIKMPAPVLLKESNTMRDALDRLLSSSQPLACICDEEGDLIAVLTPKDCFRSALNASYYRQWSDTVSTHMSRDVMTLRADLDIVAAAEIFEREPFRAYPVVDDGTLKGVLTREDLLRTFLELG